MLTGGDPAARVERILAGLPPEGLFDVDVPASAAAPCRLAPDPFPLPAELATALEAQGRLWLNLLTASQQLYLRSVRGDAPAWVARLLDAGKPRRVVEYARMNRFKSQYPVVLRPDLLLTDDGPVACELDSLPGGIGLLGCLTRLYEREGFACLGGPDGMVRGMAAALSAAAGAAAPSVALAVSEESAMYRPEMRWLAGALVEAGLDARTLPPGDLVADEAGVWHGAGIGRREVDLVYRFFELFDLPNLPRGVDVLEAAKRRRVKVTPPPKAPLEEKLLFALLHHPVLAPHWEAALGEADFGALRELAVPSWVLDPGPLPSHAVIAGLTAGGRAVQDFADLKTLTQRERGFVIKPSGFSREAWGSHGVKFGADLSQEDWGVALDEALGAFAERPHLLQPYRKPRVVSVGYVDAATGRVTTLAGRVRLCPYYFVVEEEVRLGGVLATVCPADKKAIHGMPEAVMGPCTMAP